MRKQEKLSTGDKRRFGANHKVHQGARVELTLQTKVDSWMHEGGGRIFGLVSSCHKKLLQKLQESKFY